MQLSCGCIIFCYLSFIYIFPLIISHLSTLCHFKSNELDSRSQISIPPGGCGLIFQFYLLFIKYHHKFSINIWRGMTVCFWTVSYASARIIMFLDGCWILPFSCMITIGFLVLILILRSNWCLLKILYGSYTCLYICYHVGWDEGKYMSFRKAVPDDDAIWYREVFPCFYQ